MKNLIIEKPDLVPLTNRIGWGLFTALFWIIWIYLWMPLITLFMWYLGFDFYGRLFLHNSPSQLVELHHIFLLYSSVVAALGGSLLLWARTEFMRFRNVHRRAPSKAVEIEELAQYAHQDVVTMTELNNVRRMVAYHDEHGDFMTAEID
jgi:biofilm PGA synthesis protein PgaD